LSVLTSVNTVNTFWEVFADFLKLLKFFTGLLRVFFAGFLQVFEGFHLAKTSNHLWKSISRPSESNKASSGKLAGINWKSSSHLAKSSNHVA
jgi:hypothetical protein